MGSATFTVRVASWSLLTYAHSRGKPPVTQISFQGPLEGGDRHKVGGLELDGCVVTLHRRFTPHDPEAAIHQTFKLGPDPYLDVPANERPLGVANIYDNILDVVLYPHEELFDGLLERSAHGAPMPCVCQLTIMSGGEFWEESIDWEASAQKGRLPVFTAAFSVRTAIDWPAGGST